MEIKFNYTFKYLLDHSLFVNSKSSIFQKQLKYARYTSILIPIFVALIFLFMKNYLAGLLSGLIGFFTMYSFKNRYKNRVKKTLSKHLKEKNTNLFGKQTTIILKKETLLIKIDDIENLYKYSAFESILETKNYFYLKIKIGNYLIIPKEAIYKIEEFKAYFKEVEYVNEMDWKW